MTSKIFDISVQNPDDSTHFGNPAASKTTPCPACGSRIARPLFPKERPWILRCDTCGLTRAEPQPSDDELEAIYDEHYYEQFGFVARNQDDRALSTTKRATYGRLLSQLQTHLPKDAQQPESVRPRHLLDIGCGLGYSLLEAQSRGYQALGLDPLAPVGNPRFADRTILRDTLETVELTQRFDAVTAIDVIEHVRDPIQTVRAAARLLRSDGVLMLATNDVSSLGARLLGPRWTHFHRAHLWFFTPETLSKIVSLAGLEVIATEPVWRVYNFEYIASILARGDNFRLAMRCAQAGLKRVPKALQRLPWPAVPEGFVLFARTP